MSQERIIRFSLQHNFVVKHPYENMVSFVTHAKRIGKTIFYLRMCMFLGHFIYLKQVVTLGVKYSLLLISLNISFIPDIYDCDKN